VFLLFGSMLLGLIIARCFPNGSFWLLLASAIVTIVSLGVSNTFQPDEGFHFGEWAQVFVALASGVMLGVSLTQISDFLSNHS